MMRKGMLFVLALLVLQSAPLLPTAMAQAAGEKQPAAAPPESAPKALSVYRLEFAVHEREDGRTNTRNYMMLLEEGGNCAVRASSRVPVLTETDKWVYMDVGLNIDCDARERDGEVAMKITLEVSDFAEPGQEKSGHPLLRTIRARVDTAIPPGKPTVVSQVDDAATKRSYELEVTAVKVK